MEKEVSKKTGVILLLLAIIIAVMFTLAILNYIQAPRVAEGARESSTSGEITLTIKKPPIVTDESTGSVNLEILPPPESPE
jgi:hypothetical protein|tara:strand:+ start:225 stop:467 length:243 start_codon:yes stop_codon:yes gene_type:complete